MPDLLAEYKKYYQTRYQQMAQNPLYPKSAAIEKAMCDAMNSCQRLEEFKDKLGDLPDQAAVARVLDQAKARLENFLKMDETVRAKAPEELLEKITPPKTALETAQQSAEIENSHSIPIAIDEFISEIYVNFRLLENIEVYEKAEVPKKWHADIQESKQREVNALKNAFDSHEEHAQPWKAGYKVAYEDVWEKRHRRRVPVNDETLKRRLTEIKTLRGN